MAPGRAPGIAGRAASTARATTTTPTSSQRIAPDGQQQTRRQQCQEHVPDDLLRQVRQRRTRLHLPRERDDAGGDHRASHEPRGLEPATGRDVRVGEDGAHAERREDRASGIAVAGGRPAPRPTGVIAGTRVDHLEAWETIERAHPQFGEPLLLRDVYGMSYEEIAEQVGAPIGTIKAQIHHGRKLVRPLLRGGE